MPRVENTGANVTEFCRRTGEGSSTFDVCRFCNSRLRENPHEFDDILSPYKGDPEGTEGRTGNTEHPPYEDDEYECEVCNNPLTNADN